MDGFKKNITKEDLKALKKSLDAKAIKIFQGYCERRNLNYTILDVSKDYSRCLVYDILIGNTFWTHTNNIAGHNVVGIIHSAETGAEFKEDTVETQETKKLPPTVEEVFDFRQTQHDLAKAKENWRPEENEGRIENTQQPIFLPEVKTIQEEAEKIGCHPPYFKPVIDWEECEDNEQIKEFRLAMKQILQTACDMTEGCKYKVHFVSKDGRFAYISDMVLANRFWTSVDNILRKNVTAMLDKEEITEVIKKLSSLADAPLSTKH